MAGLIFLLIVIAFIFQWLRRPRATILFFLLSFFLSVIWFFHHATDVIGLSL